MNGSGISFRRRRSLSIAAAGALAVAGFGAPGAHAAPYEVDWTNTNSDYNDQLNWTPAFSAPHTSPYNRDATDLSNGVENPFLDIGTGSATISVNSQGAFLHVGMYGANIKAPSTPAENATLSITGGTVTLGEFRVGGREIIPDYILGSNTPNSGGTGVVNQTGGTVNVTYQDPTATEPPIQSMYIGDAGLPSGNTANGTYNISNNAVLLNGIAADDAIVVGTGSGTVGAFNQSGTSSVTSTGYVIVGRAGATATYGMTGGTLNVGTGTVQTSHNLIIGLGQYPTGTYTAGTSGTFTQSAGAVNVKNDTVVGRDSGTGSYTITGTGTTLSSGNSILVGNAGTGTFTQGNAVGGTAPAVTVGLTPTNPTGSSGISVGISSDATHPGVGTYTMKGGTLNIGDSVGADFLAVGDGTAGTGTFNLQGGTITITDLLQLGRNSSNNDNRLNVSGGTINTKRVVIGGGTGTGLLLGRGTLTMTGGTINGNDNTNIGFGDTNNSCVGTLDIQGGSYNLTNTGSNLAILAVGNNPGGTGTLLLSGGSLSIPASGNSVIDIGRNNANGSFTLSGTGNLTARLLRNGNNATGTGTHTITFSGGTSNVTQLDVQFGSLTIGGGTHTITTLNALSGTTTINGGTNGIPTLNTNTGTVTINGGSNTLGTVAFGTGSTFNLNNISQTVTQANFGQFTMNIGSGATLSLSNASTASAARIITKNGAGTLNIAGTQSHFANSTLLETAGVVNLNSNSGSGLNLTSNGGTMNFGAAQTVRAITAAGGTINIGTFASTTTNPVTLTSGAINGTGAGTLNGNSYAVQSGSASAKLIGSGALTKSTSGTVTLTGANTYTGGTNVQAGTLIVNRLHESNAVNITGGTLKVADSSPTLPSFPSGQNSAVSRPGSMIAISNNAAPLGSRVYNGTLDLGNNDLIIDYTSGSPFADLNDMVRSGFNFGDWLGKGITSSTAANPLSNGNYALGIAENGTLTNPFGGQDPNDPNSVNPKFDDQTVDNTTVLIKFTHRVDLDLNGLVDGNDAAVFNGSYSEGDAANWQTGDVDYDGVYSSNDAAIFNSFYDESLGHLPEPGMLSVLAVSGVGLLRRRRARR